MCTSVISLTLRWIHMTNKERCIAETNKNADKYFVILILQNFLNKNLMVVAGDKN